MGIGIRVQPASPAARVSNIHHENIIPFNRTNEKLDHETSVVSVDSLSFFFRDCHVSQRNLHIHKVARLVCLILLLRSIFQVIDLR